MTEKLFRIEVHYQAVCKDTYYVSAGNREIAMAAVFTGRDDWEPHRSGEIVEFLDEPGEISEDGSVEIDDSRGDVQAYEAFPNGGARTLDEVLEEFLSRRRSA